MPQPAFAVPLLLFCGAVYAPALAGIGVAMLAPAGAVLPMLGRVLPGLSAVRS